MKFPLVALFLCATLAQCAEDPDTLVIKNDIVQRVLKKDGDVWRTVRFARADGSDAIDVQSDEEIDMALSTKDFLKLVSLTLAKFSNLLFELMPC